MKVYRLHNKQTLSLDHSTVPPGPDSCSFIEGQVDNRCSPA